MTARIPGPGEPAAWTALVRRVASPGSEERLAPGVCRRVELVRSSPPKSADEPHFAEALRMTGPVAAPLAWDEAHAAYGAVGPRHSLDPTWSVGDVTWTDADGRAHTAEDVVRFGALPAVRVVTRDEEGVVRIEWDPDTVEDPRILVSAPGGELQCGVGPAGVTLPWWAVPPSGGEVVLRSTRTSIADTPLRVWAKSTLELVIPLDQPPAASAEPRVLPSRPPVPRGGPRRITRPWRGWLG